VLGGAVLGGDAGAQLGMLGATAWMTKYSREYESQADQLGAQIMADAGYDPRELANVFRTIAAENRGGAPEFLSSHPDPGNRFEKINRMAETLRVGPAPPRFSPGFAQVQSRLRSMPPARTMAQIEKDTQGQGTPNPTAGGRYSRNVPYPSNRTRQYTGLNWMRVNVPSNWRDFTGGDSVQFAPEGAFGDQGITHGALIGVYQGRNREIGRDSEDYLSGVLQANSYLRQRGGFSRTTVGGRDGYTAMLSGTSPITGRSEVVTIYTTQLRTGDLLYIATVAPENENSSYSYAFRSMLGSLRLYEQSM
jgi:beta-barrel assembly-enhancing protease